MHQSLISIIITVFLMDTKAMDNLNEAFKWKLLDFKFPSERAKNIAIQGHSFEPYNNTPIGLEVWGDKVFITVPRWRGGVAASLAYIKLSDPVDSPKLTPYPNWDWHTFNGEDAPQIVSPFRIRADHCDRLWVIDSGYTAVLEGKIGSKPKLLIFDLKTDELIRNYTIPDDQYIHGRSLFCNVVVEENNCTDSFAYLSDLSRPAMLVYSFESDRSWVVQHNYFSLDPQAGSMTVAGKNFQWEDGLFGMALSEQRNGYSSLYFHPMLSFNEFNVSTSVLRDEELVKNKEELYSKFRILGSRGPKSQAGSSFYHKKTNVLFYALLQLNAVACWRTTNPNYTMESQGRIFMSNETMVFPSDLKVDKNDTLWVMSDKLPIFMYGTLNPKEYNFRILNQTVANAIRGTACDSKIKMNKTLVETITKSSGSKLWIELYAFLFAVLSAIFIR